MHSAHIKNSAQPPLVRRLDLNLLELFVCVHRLRNLTAAGDRLGLSQPAVSRAMGKLRKTYNDPLFIRLQRGVQPTPLADGLVEPISAALTLLRGTIEELTFDPSTDMRHFRIAMSDIGERLFLPRLLDRMARNAPAVTIEAVSPAFGEMHAELAAGGIDLAVGFLPGLGKSIRQQRLFRERYVYVARKGHPALKSQLTHDRLPLLPHVVACPPGMQHAAAVEKALTRRSIRAPVAMRVRSFLCVGPIVAGTDLVAVIPSNLAALTAHALGLDSIVPPIRLPGFDVSMAWHERFHVEPSLAWLRSVFVELFGPDSGAFVDARGSEF